MAEAELRAFDAYLESKTYIVGDTLTIADILFAEHIMQLALLNLSYRSELKNIDKHYENVKNEVPQVKQDEEGANQIFAHLAKVMAAKQQKQE